MEKPPQETLSDLEGKSVNDSQNVLDKLGKKASKQDFKRKSKHDIAFWICVSGMGSMFLFVLLSIAYNMLMVWILNAIQN